MKKIMFLLIFVNCFLFADFSNVNIANSLKRVAQEESLDSRLLYSIAKVESNFNPLVIAFLANKDFKINDSSVDIKILKYSKNKNLVQIRGTEKELKRLTKTLVAQGFKVDAGLMQINSANFSSKELDSIFKPEYNIYKSAKILKECKSRLYTLKDSLECYNKGFRKKDKYDYYAKVRNVYITSFGGVR